MSYLVRKINKAKWHQIDIENDNDVSADAITSCLRTRSNSLSVWKISNESDLDLAVLALVSNQDHLESIDIVILEQDTLENKYNINVVASPGVTPIHSMANDHRDLTDLRFSSLESMKNHIVERIRDNKIKRYTRGNLKELLKNAIKDGIVKFEDLKDSVRDKL